MTGVGAEMRGDRRPADEVRPMRGPGWAPVWPAVLLLAAVAMLVAAPQVAGAAGILPLAQLVALRGAQALGWAVLAAAALAALCVVLVRGPIGHRRAPAALLTGVVLVAGGAATVNVAVLAERGLELGVVAESPAELRSLAGADLTVVAFNTFGAVADDDLAEVVSVSGADLVVLPETSAAQARRVAEDLGGFTVHSSGEASDAESEWHTAILVADHLGTYRPGPLDEPNFGSRVLTRVSGSGPERIVAVHTAAPLPTAMEGWRADVPAAVGLCGPGTVAAGDFNATFDHPGMRPPAPCADAAIGSGAGGWGTWPAALPPLLGAPIDHVLHDAGIWTATGTRMLETGAGDHRALVVALDRGAAGEG